MPGRTPLTNLRDKTNGGAPIYVGGDRLSGELAPTPPEFLDDDDQYFDSNYVRRGLLTVVHVPPAGISTVDFVTLFLRNSSTTERAYVNVLLGAHLSTELRISGVPVSSPVYSDVLMLETDAGAEALATIDSSNVLSVSVVSSGQFDISLTPKVEFDPEPTGNLSAFVVLESSGSIQSITVVNPTGHSYSEPPNVRVVGGKVSQLGFFERTDSNTKVQGSLQGGSLTLIGSLCRTQFASNISQPGDVLLVNNEVRVVTSVNPDTKEFAIDRALSGVRNVFDEWSFIPFLSASKDSLYRSGNGTLNNQPQLGQNGLVCTRKHHLCTGDYVIYLASSGLLVSRRVSDVISETEFTVEENASITSSSNVAWYYIYLYSEATPGGDQLSEVQVVSYIKMLDEPEVRVIDVLGLGSRQLFLRNENFFNQAGSYFNASLPGGSRVVNYAVTSSSHDRFGEVPHEIDASSVLEIELKPQPSPEAQVLSGFPLNGGTAGETGRRPMIAVYQRGVVGRSNQVTFWGYYMRYPPESGTNYTQAINV